MRHTHVVVALFALFGSSCGAGTPVAPGPAASPTPPRGAGRAILFIGNSLTEANNLPQRVQELARDAGIAVEVASVLGSGFSLGDHIERGLVLTSIRARRWSVVVMQQGPSTLAESRALLIHDAGVLANDVRAVGGQPALLMVWPLPGQRAEDVGASYRAAAVATQSLLLPAGDAWQAVQARDPRLVLTTSDGFHPSPLGTYLAALTIHCTLYGSLALAPLGTDRARSGAALLPEQAQLLREAACAAAANR